MFTISKNTFADNGICKYSDEYGNTVFMKRKGSGGFTGKLRFYDKRIIIEPIYYDPGEENSLDGTHLNIEHPSDIKLDSPEIQTAISGFTKIVQRWIRMLSDISVFSNANLTAYGNNTGISKDSVKEYYRQCLSRMSEYDELSATINTIFS